MNIDGHLPLPFPFYDAVEKQFFRTESCLRDFRVWNLFTDVRHFPPFEIVAEDVCSGAVSGEVDAYLYDVNDNLVADLEAEYELIYQVETKTDGTRTWLVYDASQSLPQDLPIGLHYVRIDFCGQTWYSELINVCDLATCEEGLGTQLLLNADMTDWTGDDPDDWSNDENPPDTVIAELAPGGAANITAIDGDTVSLWQTVMTAGRKYKVVARIRTVSGTMTPTGLTYTTAIDTSNAWEIVTFYGYATGTDFGFITNQSGASQTLLDYVYLYEVISETCSADDRITLNWWNDCDLLEVLYQTGFRNRLYFPEKISMLSPTYNTEKEIDPVDGVDMISKVVTNKVYTFSFLAPQYMADAMVFMQMHTDIYLTTKTGETIRAQNVNVTPDYYNSCYYRIKIEFVAESVVSSSCCNNYTLMP